tara:strand:+ start:201 stop:611 length:411 start_codon:yes stop_codon:yes gene_type:complete
MKPKLVELSVVNKIIKTNIESKNDTATNIFKYMGNCMVYYTSNFIDYIILIIFIFLILYYRYKYNKNQKIIKPDQVHVNYYRHKHIYEDKTETVNDNIETDNELNDDMMKVIRNEINKVDANDLQPLNITYDNYTI